ncbi:MAG: hypothetical protein OEV89_07810 [Desulfobulbaceae bacterium]|nr:hypothetical protein [Desulfobulbaceae bacterium]HIJ90657.1 hypothetical protein [Deltaproteobacteria bacterium]
MMAKQKVAGCRVALQYLATAAYLAKPQSQCARLASDYFCLAISPTTFFLQIQQPVAP